MTSTDKDNLNTLAQAKLAFQPLLEEVEKLVSSLETSSLTEDRKRLHGEVVKTVFSIERKLNKAIGDEGLRGTRNLLIAAVPLWAWNVRKANKFDPIEFPPSGGEVDVLVMLRDGSLSIANVKRDERQKISYELFEPDDEDIHIEDLVPFVQTVFLACQHHWISSEKTLASTQRIDRLVQAIRESILKVD